MRFRSTAPALLIACLALLSTGAAAQTPARTPSTPASQTADDPLAIGKQALSRGDYAAARSFFAKYLQDNPGSTDALFFAGNAALGLKQYDEAERLFNATLTRQQTMWAAHKNLVIVYAAQGKWQQFDAERSLLKDARDQGRPGIAPNDADVIDLFTVGTDRYIVRAYATLTGRFKYRYNFTHYGQDGKLVSWIACESDDIDQIAFAKEHPQQAAAGQRSFSLDSYTIAKPSPDGKAAS